MTPSEVSEMRGNFHVAQSQLFQAFPLLAPTSFLIFQSILPSFLSKSHLLLLSFLYCSSPTQAPPLLPESGSFFSRIDHFILSIASYPSAWLFEFRINMVQKSVVIATILFCCLVQAVLSLGTLTPAAAFR